MLNASFITSSFLLGSQDDDHLLGVIIKAPSVTHKKYVVLLLTTEIASSLQTQAAPLNNFQGKESSNTPQGYFIQPKGKRGMDEEYFTSGSSRKGTGVINIKLPYRGTAAGMNYEVREIENKEFMGICHPKMKIDPVWLLEDPKNAVYSKTVQQLLQHRLDGIKYPPLLDPVKGLTFELHKRFFLFFSCRLHQIFHLFC